MVIFHEDSCGLVAQFGIVHPDGIFYRGTEKEKRNLTFLQKKLILFNNGKNRFPQHSIDPGRDHPVDIPALFFGRVSALTDHYKISGTVRRLQNSGEKRGRIL